VCARICHVFFAVLLLASLACTERRPLKPAPETEPLVHEPWEDAEAENLAWLISGEVCARRELYERIQTDLIYIRDTWGDSVPALREIRHFPGASPGTAWIDASTEMKSRMEAGEYHDWDSLNTLFNAAIDYWHSAYSPWVSVYATSRSRVNPYRMAEAYEKLPEITGVGPSGQVGDRPNLFARLHSWGISYTFRAAWGDCPAGCIASRLYYFRSTDTGLEFVGDWRLNDSVAPSWWIDAKASWELYENGDAQYRFRDATLPGRVSDLRLIGSQLASTAALKFTAPGDLGLTGDPTSYVFRWAPDSVTEENWYQLPNAGFPAKSVGIQVTVTLKSLPTHGTNVIAMRSVDKLGNVSAISNTVVTSNILQLGWTIYNSTNSPLPNDQITAIWIDTQGRCWIGTRKGLAVASNESWQTFTSADHPILTDPVTAITEDESRNIWVGTYSGAASFNGETWTTRWPTGSPSPSTEIRSMLSGDDGSMWMGVGFVGVVHLTPQGWQQFDPSNSGVRGTVVRQFLRATDHSIWSGANNGLSRYDGSTWTAYGPAKTITSIMELRNDEILSGTYDGYLYHMAGDGEWRSFQMKPYESWPRQSREVADIVQSGDGSIWLTTYGSVRRYSREDLSEAVVMLPENSPLPEREITVLAAGHDNTLWIGTRNSGVCRWDLSEAGLSEPSRTLVYER